MKVLSFILWPFAFMLVLLTLPVGHPLLDRLDRWQCGVVGHGKTYREKGYCILCGYKRST